MRPPLAAFFVCGACCRLLQAEGLRWCICQKAVPVRQRRRDGTVRRDRTARLLPAGWQRGQCAAVTTCGFGYACNADRRGSHKGRGYEGWQVGQGIGQAWLCGVAGQTGNEQLLIRDWTADGKGRTVTAAPGPAAVQYGPDGRRGSVPRLTSTATDGEIAPSWPVAGRLRPWGRMRAFVQRNAPLSWPSWSACPWAGCGGWSHWLSSRVPLVRRSLQRLGSAGCLAGAACWWSGTAA